MHHVAVIVGSLRRESINRRFANALAKLAQGRLDLLPLELGDLPMYNDDLWEHPPAAVVRLKEKVAAADAVLFVTPEYNRSIPALVKNTIDWGSRPRGQSVWTGKPAGIVGTTGGAIGTAVAQAHLRHIVDVCDMRLMTQPEVYFVTKPGLIADDHTVTDEKTREFLAGYLAKFEAWIARHAKHGG
jgi:chromate reductase